MALERYSTLANPAPTLASSSIRTMPDVLCWDGGEDILGGVHDSWLALASSALGVTLGRLCRSNSALGAELTSGIRMLSDESFERLLLAPETTFRLLPGRPTPLDKTGEFLRRSILAELALEGSSQPSNEELWTALGDARVCKSGSLIRGPKVAEWMPLDFDSPYSRDIDLTGVEYRVPDPRPPLSEGEIQLTLDRLERIRETLMPIAPLLGRFAARFTKVLVLQKDEAQPFSSGSNGDYVGRSVISNPHNASDADLADAIVHEAIHSLLYMQEEQQQWVLADALYESVRRLVSPWTGTLLPVRPFLQACFVWYGLLHFWAMACRHKAFDETRASFLFRRAASGFLHGSLMGRLEIYIPALNIDITETVNDMQSRVVAAISDL